MQLLHKQLYLHPLQELLDHKLTHPPPPQHTNVADPQGKGAYRRMSQK